MKDLEDGRGFISRSAALGFTPGVELAMVQNFNRGPLIVIVRDTHVALGRSEARKIQIRRIAQ